LVEALLLLAVVLLLGGQVRKLLLETLARHL
jgi:hypothetical protein